MANRPHDPTYVGANKIRPKNISELAAQTAKGGLLWKRKWLNYSPE